MTRKILKTLGATTDADGQSNVMHYRVDESLGEGGMAVVFAGFDNKLQRDVAIKVLKPEVSRRDDSRSRFVQEARSLAAIEHDNVVRVHAVEQQTDLPFIVMERLYGCTLAETLDRQSNTATSAKLPPLQAVHIASQIACGLRAAHEQRILHRDIKPQNVWLQRETGQVKLLDFGLAEPFGSRTHKFGGTPAYISPEQARSEPVDARTDLYSLGVVLWQMLTGRLPFVAADRSALLVALVTQPAPKITEAAVGLPEPLVQLVHGLLEKDKADRPDSAKAVLQELEACRDLLDASKLRQFARRSTRPATLAMVGVVALSVVGTWTGLNATSLPEVVGSAAIAAPKSERVEHAELLREIQAVQVELRDGVLRPRAPTPEWAAVIDAVLNCSLEGNALRVFGIVGDTFAFREAFAASAPSDEELTVQLTSGALVELDQTSQRIA